MKNQNQLSSTSNQDQTIMGVVAYITIIGLIIAYITNQEKKNHFVKYHISQSLGLTLTGIVMGVVSLIPFLGLIIYIIAFIVIIYMWIMGLINALNKQEKPLPLLGKKYEEWFKNI